MNAKERIEELLEASEDGTITAAQVTEAAEEGRNGVDELQNYLVEQQVNINDLMR